MTIYTEVFGGANIYPSEISYSALSITTDTVLSWPTETSANNDLATRIIDISSSVSGLSIFLPDAAKAGTGETILFNNVGSQSITIKDADGVQVVTVTNGTLWQIYLTDNSTTAGVWVSLQYGASLSIANASALAGTGIVAVGPLLSQSVPITSLNVNYTTGVADRAKMFNWTGAGGTLSLPDPTIVGNNWFIYLRNSGTGAIVADAIGSTLIDGSAFLSFQPGESAIIASDGVNCYTIGFGQSATFAFDYTVIAVGGTGNYTLSGTELNRISYRFTGTLTGNRTIIVPATVQQYWVDNQCTGAYSFTVKTVSGLGVTITAGTRSILYCDGTDVVRADTFTIAYPIAVSQGGTGSTTAGGAILNLGAGSVGASLFTAVTQDDAWAVLGPSAVGTVDGGVFT